MGSKVLYRQTFELNDPRVPPYPHWRLSSSSIQSHWTITCIIASVGGVVGGVRQTF